MSTCGVIVRCAPFNSRGGRPYKKDDNAHIEQKNWTHVRRQLGYVRYDTEAARNAMNDLYRNELRLFQNLFLPSVKLSQKERVGSRLRRHYEAPQTPFQRVTASAAAADPERVAELRRLRETLDPFQLSKTVEQKLEAIYRLSAEEAVNRDKAVEMTRRGKRGKLKQRVSPSSLCAWKSGNNGRIPTFPQHGGG